jgi:hypothetical protein
MMATPIPKIEKILGSIYTHVHTHIQKTLEFALSFFVKNYVH